MDSWIYPALDRLGALGLVPSQIAGLRPWTRLECHRQVLEAEELLRDKADELGDALVSEARRLMAALRRELEAESGRSYSAVLESVSIRNGVIAGPLLDDSLHFGQTWVNDFGRPYGRGWNSNAGMSARARSGRFFAALRAEYQHAPGRGPDPLAVRQSISGLDSIPLPAARDRAATDRFRLLEASAGVRVKGLEFSLGKQSLFWGPGYGAPLSFSSNAEPTKNLKIALVHPLQLPGLLGYFGRIRGEFVIGKLGGHTYTWRPWFNAQKLSFKLTDNLEMGFTRWSIFWGAGHPITLRSFFRNFASVASTGSGGFPDPTDPGDLKGGFDFRYRIPWMRKWLTLYSDSYCDDDPSPLAAPQRSAFSPGIYLSYIPGIPQLDLRVEMASTRPLGSDHGGGFIYWNGQYRSGNTNYGNLLGSWVGRDGRAIQAWSTYWLSARNKIELGFRHSKGGARFVPGGSSQTAGKVTATFQLARDWHAETMLQCERFWVPVLGGPQRNISGWLQLRWEPKLELHREKEKQR